MPRGDDFTPITDEYKLLVEYPNDYDPSEEKDIDTFNELFEFSLHEMARVYKIHREKKGDSWKKCPIKHLRGRFGQEFVEWENSVNDSGMEYNELIDILNVGLMLLERLADTHGCRVADCEEKGRTAYPSDCEENKE